MGHLIANNPLSGIIIYSHICVVQHRSLKYFASLQHLLLYSSAAQACNSVNKTKI